MADYAKIVTPCYRIKDIVSTSAAFFFTSFFANVFFIEYVFEQQKLMSEISGRRLVSYGAAIRNVFLLPGHEDKFCEFNVRLLFPSIILVRSAKM